MPIFCCQSSNLCCVLFALKRRPVNCEGNWIVGIPSISPVYHLGLFSGPSLVVPFVDLSLQSQRFQIWDSLIAHTMIAVGESYINGSGLDYRWLQYCSSWSVSWKYIFYLTRYRDYVQFLMNRLEDRYRLGVTSFGGPLHLTERFVDDMQCTMGRSVDCQPRETPLNPLPICKHITQWNKTK